MVPFFSHSATCSALHLKMPCLLNVFALSRYQINFSEFPRSVFPDIGVLGEPGKTNRNPVPLVFGVGLVGRVPETILISIWFKTRGRRQQGIYVCKRYLLYTVKR